MASGGGDVRRTTIRALPTKQSKNQKFRFLNSEVPDFEFFHPEVLQSTPLKEISSRDLDR